MKTVSIHRKKSRLIIALSFPALIALFFVYQNVVKPKKDKRQKYEVFLQNKYKDMPDFSEEKTGKLAKGDRPDMAFWQDYFMTLEPETGIVPTERLVKAYEQKQKLKKKKRNTDDLQWKKQAAHIDGRTRALMLDPNDAEHKKIWVGSVTGGVWYNNDITSSGSEWQPVSDFWQSLSVSCLTYDPQNTQTFYAGTGEGETAIITYRQSSGKGVGIWKSENAGETWELLPSTTDFAYITDIKIRIEDRQSVIYAAVISGGYEAAENQSQPPDGLYRSDDGGDT